MSEATMSVEVVEAIRARYDGFSPGEIEIRALMRSHEQLRADLAAARSQLKQVGDDACEYERERNEAGQEILKLRRDLERAWRERERATYDAANALNVAELDAYSCNQSVEIDALGVRMTPRWIVAHPEIPGPRTMVCAHCGKLPGYTTHQGNPENYCTCDPRPSDAPRTEPMPLPSNESMRVMDREAVKFIAETLRAAVRHEDDELADWFRPGYLIEVANAIEKLAAQIPVSQPLASEGPDAFEQKLNRLGFANREYARLNELYHRVGPEYAAGAEKSLAEAKALHLEIQSSIHALQAEAEQLRADLAAARSLLRRSEEFVEHSLCRLSDGYGGPCTCGLETLRAEIAAASTPRDSAPSAEDSTPSDTET